MIELPSSPFSRPRVKGKPPYWLRSDEPKSLAEHRRLNSKLHSLHSKQPSTKPGRSRSWHIEDTK